MLYLENVWYTLNTYFPDFLHPCDKANIKTAKEERAYCRVSGGRGVRRQFGRKKWSSDNNYEDRNDYGNGVQKRGNAWI